jgi:general secretion pathway protein H
MCVRKTMRFAPRSPCGFTLVEILVVIIIVGVIIAVTTISVGVLGRDHQAEDQAKRIAAVMTQAREEGDLQGRDIGILVEPDAYEFLYYDQRKQVWTDPIDDDMLERRKLPEGLHFRLWLESKEIILKAQAAQKDLSDEDLKKRGPHILLLASGDLSPFELQIQREGGETKWHVISQPDDTVAAEEMHDKK